MIQSDYHSDEDHGNFEALVPMDDGLWHWFRNNATGQWTKIVALTNMPGSLGCIISSDYVSNPGHRNFEALVYEPRPGAGEIGALSHFFWDGAVWTRTYTLTRTALGPAGFIQGDYTKGADHYNLEAIVWEADGDRRTQVLRHYFRDDQNGMVWQQGALVSTRPFGPSCVIQSDFRSDKDHGNFEELNVEWDNDVWHKWRDQSTLLWISGGAVT